MLFLDEPISPLDIKTRKALADSVNEFESAKTLISPDFRLIQEAAQLVWVCQNQTISTWPGDSDL